MGHIINLAVLGLLAGALSGFLTRITMEGMIFQKFGKWMDRYNNSHLIIFVRDSPMISFMRCVFCMTPYIVVLFDVIYIAEYTPKWTFCIVGVLAGIGVGNLMAEIIHHLRK